MIFDCLQRFFLRHNLRRRVPLQQQLMPAEYAAERLEERTLLTPFYDLDVVAGTGFGEFESFGDLVTINNVVSPGGQSSPAGTVAFVGYTDLDNDETPESGLWTVDSAYQLTNINPEYSDTNGRDFGRAVDLNDQGILVARDRYAGAPAQFFVRTWDSDTPDEHTNIGSANSLNQPDYGQFSGLQTFTDINDRGDVVYVGQSLDVTYRSLMIKPVGEESRPFFTLPIHDTVPRPQLTEDGRVLYRATDSYLALLNFETGVAENVAAGFTNIGYASGISKDGRLVAFVGDQGNGLGVYLAYQSGGSYKTVRIAGAGEDGWSEFDPTDAVRVNHTLLTERGVTVAYEAVHGTLGRGIYTTRVSFIDPEGPVDWDPDYGVPYVQGAVPVALVGDALGSQTISDVEFWNGLNDRNRGELGFWVQTNGGDRIVRATPWQVVSLDFSPVGKPITSYSVATASLLADFGVTNNVGWDANFATAMQSAGLTSLATTSARTDIVNTIQSYFQDAGARVRVVGRSGESPPAYVPWSAPIQVPLRPSVHGVYQTILVGAKVATADRDKGEYGMASPPYAGQGGIDYFNQIADDYAVVFADRIFAANGAFTNPATAPDDKLIQAIASIIAHEAGHNFGLYHLEDDVPATANEIMRTTTLRDADLTTVAHFSNALFPREAYVVDENLFTPGQENSVRRLIFGTGARNGSAPAPMAPDELALNANADSQRANLPYTPSGQGPTVARLLLGVKQAGSGEMLPEFIDLGTGNIAQLLAAARLSLQPGTEVILLGSTDGTRLDIIGVPNGTSFDLTELDPTFLGITADGRLRAAIDPLSGNSGFQLHHIPEAGAPVLMGTVDVQNVPELGVLAVGAVLDNGANFGLGETTPGGGPLSRVLTIRNSGSGPLTLGTVAITGAGYSITQPGQTTLAAGEATTITVTLSDGTAGVGLEGQLTIPSNDPAGAFHLTLRGTVDSRPRILGITRLDNGTGPVQVAIDFSGLLQPGPAGIAGNFTISGVNGEIVPVATAVYSEQGLLSRVTLTSSSNASEFSSGDYRVRIDGTQVVTSTGAPLATSRANLLSHQVWESVDTVIIGADGSGQAAVLAGPETTGYSPPNIIVQGDYNYDGVPDFVAISQSTGELIFHWGLPDGGYETQAFAIAPPQPDIKSLPKSMIGADWNSDGFDDLIVLDQASDIYAGTFQRLLIYLNDGSGNFALAPDTPIPVESDVGGPILGVGDFTGDGLLDIAVAGPPVDGSPYNYSAKGSVAIYGKDPFLGYTQVALVSTEHSEWYPVSGVTTDFNNDGRMDLVVETIGYYVYGPRPVVFLGSPTGLVIAPDLEYYGEGGDVGVGDFTDDGKVDIVIVNDNYSNSAGVQDGSVISLLRGDGTGQFIALPNIVLGRRGVSLAEVGDVDLDGELDLVLLAVPFSQEGFETTPESSVWTLRGRGFGDFDVSAAVIPLAPTGDVNPGNFILRDLTGDGYPDLTYGNLATGQIGLFVNDGSGILTPSRQGPLASVNTAFRGLVPAESGIIIVDLNRDGFADQLRVIAGVDGSQPAAVDILWGTADGDFEIVSSMNIAQYEYSSHDQYVGDIGFLKVGDLNNDGWLDLILGGYSGYGGPLEIYLGVDGRNFSRAAEFLVDAGAGLGVLTGELADLNGDGNLDFVAVISNNGAEPTGFGVFFGNGTGKLTYNSNAFQTVPGMSTQIPAIADFNGDHILDVALGTSLQNGMDDASRLITYFGIGNGKFNLGQSLVVDPSDSGGQIFLHDINGDGLLDVLSPSEQSLYFYLGTEGGTFVAAPELTISIGFSVAQLVVGDFTGDGFGDIAITQTTGYISNLVTYVPIHAGDGTGHFGGPQLVETGALWPFSLVLIPIAGTIEAGSFAISLPVLSVPAGAVNVSATTPYERPVGINPRQLLSGYTHDPIALGVSVEPLHGTVTVQTNGTPGDVSDDTFVYTPASGFSGSDSFTFLAADGRGGTATGIVTIAVAPANQNPVLTLSPGALNYFTVGDNLFLGANAVLTDADSGNLQDGKLTVTISGGFDPNNDRLYLETTGNGPGQIWTEYAGNFEDVYYSGVLVGKYTGGYDQPLTFTFTTAAATPAVVQAILRQVTYSNYDFDRTDSAQRAIAVVVTDGDGGITSTTITILLPAPGSNLAPVIATTSGDAVYVAGSAAIVIDDAATVIDADTPNFAGGSLTVDFPSFTIFDDRLAIRHVGTDTGQINLSGNTVKYGSTVIGTYSGGFVDSSSLVIAFNSNATPAIVQALLQQITFANISDNPYLEPRDIRFVVNDGQGGVSAPAVRAITIAEPSLAPEITLSNGITQYAAGSQNPVVVDDGAVVTVNNSTSLGGGSLTVSFLSGQSSADRLGIQNQGPGFGQINLTGNMVRQGLTVIGTYSGGFVDNSALVISFNTNADDGAVEALLRNITFHVASGSPAITNRVVRFVLDDGQLGVSDPADKTVAVSGSALDEAPVVQLPGPTVTYSKLAAPMAIDSQAVVIDPGLGSGTVGGGTLTISINDVNTGKRKFDVFNLSALNNVGVARGTQLINGRWVVVIDLNSNTTAQEVRNALRSVTFQTSKKGLKFSTRSVQIQLADSEGDLSAKVTKTINVSKKRVK